MIRFGQQFRTFLLTFASNFKHLKLKSFRQTMKSLDAVDAWQDYYAATNFHDARAERGQPWPSVSSASLWAYTQNEKCLKTVQDLTLSTNFGQSV